MGRGVPNVMQGQYNDMLRQQRQQQMSAMGTQSSKRGAGRVNERESNGSRNGAGSFNGEVRAAIGDDAGEDVAGSVPDVVTLSLQMALRQQLEL